MKRYFFSYILFSIAILSIVTTFYRELSIALGITILLMLLDKMGKGIVLLETIAFFYTFTCLLMPIMGYEYYNFNNPMAKLWLKYMPVREVTYFSFALPAVSFFCFAILLPFVKKGYDDQGEKINNLIVKVKDILRTRNRPGLVIIGIGVIVFLILNYLPGELQFFASLFFFSSFAGLLYVYFSPGFRYKIWILLFFVLFILYYAIYAGMFTIVAYMGITIFSFLLIGKKSSLITKILIFLAAAFFLIVLQNVKRTYRDKTWHSNYGGNRIMLFTDLFWTNVSKGDALVETDAFFPIYVRTNQGFNIALVMRRIPTLQQFDNGNRLATVFASAFVPRILWPDKPEAGGKFNMKYYAGFNIKNWSTNVGPLGEAYGSFGVTGGIIYMCLLGFFLRWVYLRVIVLSSGIPLLICWVPVLFYQLTYSAESDTLQILNSVIKSAFFIWLVYKFLPGWFCKEKKVTKMKHQISIPPHPKTVG